MSYIVGLNTFSPMPRIYKDEYKPNPRPEPEKYTYFDHYEYPARLFGCGGEALANIEAVKIGTEHIKVSAWNEVRLRCKKISKRLSGNGKNSYSEMDAWWDKVKCGYVGERDYRYRIGGGISDRKVMQYKIRASEVFNEAEYKKALRYVEKGWSWSDVNEQADVRKAYYIAAVRERDSRVYCEVFDKEETVVCGRVRDASTRLIKSAISRAASQSQEYAKRADRSKVLTAKRLKQYRRAMNADGTPVAVVDGVSQLTTPASSVSGASFASTLKNGGFARSERSFVDSSSDTDSILKRRVCR